MAAIVVPADTKDDDMGDNIIIGENGEKNLNNDKDVITEQDMEMEKQRRANEQALAELAAKLIQHHRETLEANSGVVSITETTSTTDGNGNDITATLAQQIASWSNGYDPSSLIDETKSKSISTKTSTNKRKLSMTSTTNLVEECIEGVSQSALAAVSTLQQLLFPTTSTTNPFLLSLTGSSSNTKDDDHSSKRNKIDTRIIHDPSLMTSGSTTITGPDGSKQYRCLYPDCNKYFPRLYNLKSHQRTHTDERPHKCDMCTQTFARRHDLRRHQKIHDESRTYRCYGCDKTFSRRDALNRHKKNEKSKSACKDTPVGVEENGQTIEGISQEISIRNQQNNEENEKTREKFKDTRDIRIEKDKEQEQESVLDLTSTTSYEDSAAHQEAQNLVMQTINEIHKHLLKQTSASS